MSVFPGKFMSDDPVWDAERYYEAQEADYAMRNSCARCDCCGMDCGAEDHYDVNGKIACSRECARKLLTDKELDDVVDEYIDAHLDEIIDEWLDEHVITANEEYDMQYR